MKIGSVSLTNFKRFTELHIEQIPENTKLVLIIGSNGSGKSSVFDSFDFLQKGIFKKMPYGNEVTLNYYAKDKKKNISVEVNLHRRESIVKHDWDIKSGHELAKKFIGRSSNRIVPRITNNANPEAVRNDSDSPATFIENDERFITDSFLYIQGIHNAVTTPIITGQQVDGLKIFHDFIEPLNSSLKNIFAGSPQTTLQIVELIGVSPREPANLIFQKGRSKITYDFLSHGEKQVVTLLINFIVRQEHYQEAIIYIDEMDVHLNTKLQYNTIKEITERWIPSDSQLWTASHALGFIDYANDYAEGVTLDFDDWDYDKPQTIIPSVKNNFQLFELAVSKEFLDKTLQSNAIFFSEQRDARIYNDLTIENTLFFAGTDKLSAFHIAKGIKKKAFVDRDYITDDELRTLKSTYPFLYFTPYYNIETLLFHPDNLDEYYRLKGKPFDKKKYLADILSEKNKELVYLSAGIAKARDGYPFYKENEYAKLHKQFKENTKSIIDMLKQDDFEIYYKVFNAKEYGKTIEARQNTNARELSKTNWFKQQILNALK